MRDPLLIIQEYLSIMKIENLSEDSPLAILLGKEIIKEKNRALLQEANFRDILEGGFRQTLLFLKTKLEEILREKTDEI